MDEATKIITTYAAAGAATTLASGLLPVVSDVAALGIAVGFTWSLYISINNKLGLNVDRAALKTIVSGVLANIAGNIASLIATAVVASFFPGAGGLAWAALIFGTIYLSGVTYIAALKKLCKGCFSTADLSAALQQELKHRDIVNEVKQGSQIYKQGRKDGTFSGKEKVELEQDA